MNGLTLTKGVVVMALLLATALLSCSQPATKQGAAPAPPKLLIISSLIGYVEPCGCTVDLLLGGIDRLVGEVDRARAQGPVAVLVAGPHLFEKAVEKHRVNQEKAKARLLAKAMQRMQVDAYTTTPAEKLHGDTFYAELQEEMPGRAVNLASAEDTGLLLDVGGARVGVLGAVLTGDDSRPTEVGMLELVRHEAARLRRLGAHMVVGLAVMPRTRLRSIARQVETVDLWVLGTDPTESPVASPAGKAFIIEAGDRGRNLAEVTLLNSTEQGTWQDPFGAVERRRREMERRQRMRALWQRPSERKALKIGQSPSVVEAFTGPHFKYTLRPMKMGVAGAPDMTNALAHYNESLKAMNLASAGTVPPPPPGSSRYAGEQACADCHPDAHDVWAKTRHGKAWSTLEKGKKTFDSECVGCHVTGWQEPGGSILGQVAGLENVQCEVCHGPGELHAEAGGDPALIVRAAPEVMCKSCHNKHHSPKFNYQAYLPKILGPGHQLAEGGEVGAE